MAIHSSNLAWRIPWTEEPGRLQSMGSRESLFVLPSWNFYLTNSSLSVFVFCFFFLLNWVLVATHGNLAVACGI